MFFELFFVSAAGDERSDPQQEDGADDGRSEASECSDGDPSDEREEPSAEHAADQADNQVNDQSRAGALDDEVGDPSGRQTDE